MAMTKAVDKARAKAKAAKEEENPAKRKAGREAMASMVLNLDLLGPHPQKKVDGQPKNGLNGTEQKAIAAPHPEIGTLVLGKKNPRKRSQDHRMMVRPPDMQVVMIDLGRGLTTNPLQSRA